MAERMAALEGRGQIVRAINDEWRAQLGFSPIGMPATEVFPDEWLALASAARAYRTAAPVWAHGEGGSCHAWPLWEGHELWGVAISLRPLALAESGDQRLVGRRS